MTKVRVQAVELHPDGTGEQIILEIDVASFSQGAQFGEASEAVTFAQRVVKAAERLSMPRTARPKAGPP